MIIREPKNGFRLLIPQPAHAVLSGQILAAWGAPGFALPDPAEAVLNAAAQHDVAWMEWEAAPTLDPATGLPHSFMALGGARHAPLWARGVELARAAWGLWAALLVSRHGALIYRRFSHPEHETEADRAAIAAYLAEQEPLQRQWAAALKADPHQVERNSALVAAADSLSLALCLQNPAFAGTAPLAEGPPTRLQLLRRGPHAWSLSPWPFRAPRLTLRCEALRMTADAHWSDEETMRQALRDAPRVTLAERLLPG